ncbi:MFS transporter [Pseudonocardia sulfidoxydans NBRC 16205]|uniref:MFS transporter n=1 Tax=Pseudonocardia sulfidoxydans NBRC 16205 TaxID=1223511 RepID=A0A511DPE8_9PSEU|nr:sugar porter family MFS transporter [Pseudonocardia sulfidoxydans]GEL25674.1 MFS transporter [Pseudonocardia sulfidoxydans NBRC 16205]
MTTLDSHAGTRRATAVAAAAAVGGFLFGFDTAVINGAVDALTDHFELGSALSGFAVACALLGSAIGAWFAGPVADRIGRVRVMLLAAALFGTSSLGSGLAVTVWDLMGWRVLAGVGVGVASVIAPAYIAEISPAAIRGRLGSLQQLAIVSGIFLALLSDAVVADWAGGAANTLWWGLGAWRWMFLIGLIPAVIYALLAWGLPESPRFLVARGRLEEAAGVLRRLDAGTPGVVQTKITDIAAALGGTTRPRLADLRGRRAGLLPIVWVGILLSVFQQFVGINVIFYYSTSLWRSVGFSESDSFTITVITSVTNIVVTIAAIAAIDKVGRKPLLIGGSVGMTLSLATMAVCFSQASGSGSDLSLPGAYGTVALVAANLFVVFFGVSWGPVVWVLLGEIFPSHIRAAALSVAAAAQWIANFIVSSTFPVLAAAGLVFAYGIYALFALLSGLFVVRVVDETKGRELEEIGGATALGSAGER